MAEVAGLVLAVLPLFISAVEHYNDCFCPLHRYAHFYSGVERFQRSLEVRRQVFRNQCAIILETVVEGDIANLMLTNVSHAKWSSQTLETNLRGQLGVSADAIVSTIQEIDKILNEVNGQHRVFQDAVGKSKQDGIVGDKAWRRCVKAKWKYAFSRAQIDKHLADLTAYNEILITLYDQTLALDNRCALQEQGATIKRHTVEKFRVIQRASQNVYQALERGCSKHTEHLARFCLEVVADEPSAGSDHPHIKFKLAFGSPIFFVIESVVKEDVQHGQIIKQIENITTESLKRESLPCLESRRKKITKSVRFAEGFCASKAPLPSVRNLCMNKNLCDHLRSYIQVSCDHLKLLGTLDEIDCHKHLVYATSTPSAPGNGLTPDKSLQQLLRDLAKLGPAARLSRPVQVRLARLLATALLQYHTTPWLQRWWSSQDIYFHGLTGGSLMETVSPEAVSPHINIRLCEEPKRIQRAPTFPFEGIAPNPFLYGLGILLIEIAYTTPLDALTIPSDAVRGPNMTEWHAAKRLSQSVSRELGTSYGTIVRKCLRCNFGCDSDDLSSPELQNAFYSGVVQELGNLENDLLRLHI